MPGRCGWMQGVKMPCKTLGWGVRRGIGSLLSAPLLSHQAARCRAPFPQLHPLVLTALVGGPGDGANGILAPAATASE